MDNSNYVGYTFNAPCSSAKPWAVVVGGSYQGCYGSQSEAENAFNAAIGAASGATSNSPTAGNSVSTPVAIAGTAGAAVNVVSGTGLKAVEAFLSRNVWLTIGGGIALAVVLSRRH